MQKAVTGIWSPKVMKLGIDVLEIHKWKFDEHDIYVGDETLCIGVNRNH